MGFYPISSYPPTYRKGGEFIKTVIGLQVKQELLLKRVPLEYNISSQHHKNTWL
jgi:hypothetical protein